MADQDKEVTIRVRHTWHRARGMPLNHHFTKPSKESRKKKEGVGGLQWGEGGVGGMPKADQKTQCSYLNVMEKQHVHLSEQFVGRLVGCLTSQQQASVSQGRIWTDNFTCCHTEIEVADPTFYLTQSQYTDTMLTSPRVSTGVPVFKSLV